MRRAHLFSNIFRFVDDLCTFNNDILENNHNDIYREGQQLKRENKDPFGASLSDL